MTLYKDNIFLIELQTKGQDSPWRKSMDCKIGDEITFQLHYRNGGYKKAADVMVSVSLPENMQYVDSSAVLYNASNPDGLQYKDPTVEAVNIGDYQLYGDAYLQFKTIITNETLEKGKTNRLITWVKVTSNGEALQDHTQTVVELSED